MSVASDDDKTKIVLKTTTLPSEIRAAQKELCRLHKEREPFNEELKRINKEMEKNKAVLKTFCVEQAAEGVQSTSFEDEDLGNNSIRVTCVAKVIKPTPTAEDVICATGQLLNLYRQQLCKTIVSNLVASEQTSSIYSQHKDALLNVITQSLKGGTMELLADIRKAANAVAGESKIQYAISMSDQGGSGGSKKRKTASH